MENGEVYLMKNEKVKVPGDPGFSLVEIMIVLAVFAALSAIAVPLISSTMSGMQLAADTQNISSTLSSARMSAKSSMTPHRLVVDLDNNEWRLEKFNRTSGSFELQRDVYQLSTGLTGSGITFVGSSTSAPGTFPSKTSGTIRFNTRGIPVDMNNVPTSDNIIYLSKSGTDYAISVTLTGKVQVWKNDKGQWEVQ
jgi:prepilin-type N-terminal cleavage/methylation domain-containing protein